MIRTCDGRDPNLTRATWSCTRDDAVEACGDCDGCRYDAGRPRTWVPCACGLTFDDVDYLTTWPHERIPTHAERHERLRVLAEEVRSSDPELAGWLEDLLRLREDVTP